MLDEKLVFLVSLKARASSRDWEDVVRNFRNTLRSIQASTDDRFAIVVAGHDDPREVDPELPAYEFLTANYDPPTDPRRGGHDKYRKRRIAGAWLRGQIEQSVRVMFLDADDLVHRDLVRKVMEVPGRVAFSVDQGYRLDVRYREMELRGARFFMVCGSSFVGTFQKHELPTRPADKQAWFSKFTKHSRTHILAAEKGLPVHNLGFPAVVYLINHGDSLERQLGKKKRIGQERSLSWDDARALVKDAFALELPSDDG